MHNQKGFTLVFIGVIISIILISGALIFYYQNELMFTQPKATQQAYPSKTPSLVTNSPAPTASSEINTNNDPTITIVGNEAKITGIITDVNHGCWVDASCSIQLNNKIWIGYDSGSTPLMLSDNPPARGTINGGDFSKDKSQYIGKRVEAYVATTPDGSFTLYGSSKYYIKIID